MCYDYTITHRKFQATRYIYLFSGILHIRKHLSESQIAQYFFEVLAAYVMTYDDILFSAYNFGMRSSGYTISTVA